MSLGVLQPIQVEPGVFYVFRDKDAEQHFLVDRYRLQRDIKEGLDHRSGRRTVRTADPTVTLLICRVRCA